MALAWKTLVLETARLAGKHGCRTVWSLPALEPSYFWQLVVGEARRWETCMFSFWKSTGDILGRNCLDKGCCAKGHVARE